MADESTSIDDNNRNSCGHQHIEDEDDSNSQYRERIMSGCSEQEGIEESLSSWGMGFCILGILAGIILIWMAGTVNNQYRSESWGEAGVVWYFMALGVGAILQGMFLRVLLRAGAEIIRLLRKLNSK